MRYSLLNFLACPSSKTEFVCLSIKENPLVLPHVRQFSQATRINQPGAVVGPLPAFQKETELAHALRREACDPAPPARNYEVMVEEGLLVSGETGRWYPIRNFIPELLPDHLRDFDRDFAFLDSLRSSIPGAIFERLNERGIFSTAKKEDQGAHHKLAEIKITEKVSDPNFFGPGYISPFNPNTREHSVFLIKMFAFCLPMLLGDGMRRVVLDSGCGYSWTTHWLMMSGFEPIGIDISRIYLDIAVSRLGASLPYVVVGDTENLPIQDSVLDAVLGFDAFHHIPDRKRAMQEFYRTLRAGGEVVLSEPGSNHEQAPDVQAIMDRFGTLEKGMNLEDVISYVQGTRFDKPQQHLVLKLEQGLAHKLLKHDVIDRSSYAPANLFTIKKR
jgi:SAM-dependent methyltransferase